MSQRRGTVPAMVHYYFAIGGKPSAADLDIALLCGQRHFLVPFATPMEFRLRALARTRDDLHVVLDSRAWPPGDPNRPSREAYHQAILAWQRSDGSFRGLDYAIAYDHIGDGERSMADYDALMRDLTTSSRTLNGAMPTIVPVLQYPASVDTMLWMIKHSWPAARLNELDRTTSLPPAFAIGGMVPHRYSNELRAWWDEFLAELELAIEFDEVDPRMINLHLLGIGKPDWALSGWGLVQSTDSSGPARMAALGGWNAIERRYRPEYGLSPDALHNNRYARLAYWIIAYRDRLGLTWAPVDEREVLAIGGHRNAVKAAPEQLPLSLFAA